MSSAARATAILSQRRLALDRRSGAARPKVVGTTLATSAHVHRDPLSGALLGVALGDALGLPFEGLSARRVSRRFESPDRFRLLGRTGFVSDDTEQSALVAQALTASDDESVIRSFRRSMVGWFLRLPFGIGGATLRSCIRMFFGARRPGVSSAGNGAAMRAGIVGVHLRGDPDRRRRLGRSLAQLTHDDERAVQAALYVAELAAECAPENDECLETLVDRARSVVTHPELAAAIARGRTLATSSHPTAEQVGALGNTGFVVHSMALCTFCFIRFGTEPLRAIEAAIRAGGDTDTHAAIVGAWVGALHGASALPATLVARLHDGPFGPTHLRRLAHALANGQAAPRWSRLGALARNLALYPVILAHGFARLIPR